MTYSNLKPQLDDITAELARTDGVGGSLVADGNGEVLSQYMGQDVDTDLFGPMAHVITSSSKRLVDYGNQGKIERVLMESEGGKALFMHLGNVHFIVTMDQKANLGLVMISSKRAAKKIMDLTRDLSPLKLEKSAEKLETPVETLEEKYEVLETPSKVEVEEPVQEKPSLEKSELISKVQFSAKKTSTTPEEPKDEPKATIEPLPAQTPEQEITAEKSKIQIPIIKPPIAFPKVEKVVKIPEDEEKRADLILNIYETIFKAMSIGASKIMGVTPARGLTRKFLPTADCKLLEGVDVKSNSTLDFEKIKENANKIPLDLRENSFINDFTKILEVITEKYGQVMGYGAFRGMVRPEFKIITESYGEVMDELGIREKMHPGLLDLVQ